MPRCEECGAKFKVNWPYGKESKPLFDGRHDRKCPNIDKKLWQQFKGVKRKIWSKVIRKEGKFNEKSLKGN